MHDPVELKADLGDTQMRALVWRGSGEPVLLLHATGFHGRCWSEVVHRLEGRHTVAVDLPYHGGSRASGRPDWAQMARDIDHFIEILELRDIVAAGHSIGGHLLARVAARDPERFRHLILVDPVIMPRERYEDFREWPADVEPDLHPVSKRKNDWRDAGEMHERFRDRSPFDTWDDAVLRDYCDYALLPADEDGLRRLACDPLHEAGIYLNQRGNESIYKELPKLVMPITLLRAPPSEDARPGGTFSPTWAGLASVLPNCRETYLPDHNHFIPMQDPALVARHILAAQ